MRTAKGKADNKVRKDGQTDTNWHKQTHRHTHTHTNRQTHTARQKQKQTCASIICSFLMSFAFSCRACFASALLCETCDRSFDCVCVCVCAGMNACALGVYVVDHKHIDGTPDSKAV